MEALLIISTVLCFGYIAATKAYYPELTCISETWYKCGYGFTGWCWVTAFTLLPIMLDKTEGEGWQFLAFLSCGALLFLGAFPRYLHNETAQHYSCAVTAGLMAVAWTMFFISWWVGLIILALVVASYFVSLWLAEVVGLAAMYVVLWAN